MTDPTQRPLGLAGAYPDFVDECEEELRSNGPERLEKRAERLERRISHLERRYEEAESETREKIMDLLQRHHSDVETEMLEDVTDAILEGIDWTYNGGAFKGAENDRPFFEEAVSAEENRRIAFEMEINEVIKLRSALKKARQKQDLIRYMLDDWSRGELPKDLGKQGDELPPDFLEERPTLRKKCEKIVEVWQDPERDIGNKMGNLKQHLEHTKWDRPVTDIQNRLRDEGINDEYEHRNAQSFCKLIHRLLQLDASL